MKKILMGLALMCMSMASHAEKHKHDMVNRKGYHHDHSEPNEYHNFNRSTTHYHGVKRHTHRVAFRGDNHGHNEVVRGDTSIEEELRVRKERVPLTFGQVFLASLAAVVVGFELYEEKYANE